jgi:dolichol-phosphate mannosyltransferase
MPILWPIAAIQLVLGVSVIARMLRTANGMRLRVPLTPSTPAGAISVIVPVLNEFGRLGTCLERLIACGPEVREILVVDGGSIDGTQKIIASFAAADPRVRAISAAPIPPNWNGKAWGLECGLRSASTESTWIATIDADVRVRPALFGALVAWARDCDTGALSIATKQDLGDLASSIVHPAMLATLVYRYGLPGHATSSVNAVQANGQCFLAQRQYLIATDAFARARSGVCEDVQVARTLARAGHRVGFYEAGDLAVVRMYETWRETWANWPRSLTLRDGISAWRTTVGLAEVLFVQALPLALILLLTIVGHLSLQRSTAFDIALVLLIVRVGVMAGTHRAYRNSAWTYWLSLFADLPVAAALIASALRRRHTWRGRALVISERNT